MRKGVAFEILVQVRMGVEMEDVQGAVNLGQCGDAGKAHHMIPAQRDRDGTGAGGVTDRAADQVRIFRRFRQRDVSSIFEQDVGAEFEAVFGKGVAMLGMKRRADDIRCRGGAAQKGRMAVGGKTDQADHRFGGAHRTFPFCDSQSMGHLSRRCRLHRQERPLNQATDDEFPR